jgi:hypothetical protein
MMLPLQLEQPEVARPFRVTSPKQAAKPLNRLSRRHTHEPEIHNRYL